MEAAKKPRERLGAGVPVSADTMSAACDRELDRSMRVLDPILLLLSLQFPLIMWIKLLQILVCSPDSNAHAQTLPCVAWRDFPCERSGQFRWGPWGPAHAWITCRRSVLGMGNQPSTVACAPRGLQHPLCWSKQPHAHVRLMTATCIMHMDGGHRAAGR